MRYETDFGNKLFENRHVYTHVFKCIWCTCNFPSISIYIYKIYIYIYVCMYAECIYLYIHTYTNILFTYTHFTVYIHTFIFGNNIYIRERFRFDQYFRPFPAFLRFWGEDCCQDRWNWWRPQDQWQPQRESVPRFGRSKTSVKIKGNPIIQLNPRYEFHQHKYQYLKQQPFLF